MNKIFWIDLEMTGLDHEKEVIIEVAVIITDLNFAELEQYHAIVKQPQSFLDNMDQWNTKTHKETGLIQKVPTGKPPLQVEDELISLSQRHFKKNEIIIAGNSIHQDRLFIKKYFPRFNENSQLSDVRHHILEADFSAQIWQMV